MDTCGKILPHQIGFKFDLTQDHFQLHTSHQQSHPHTLAAYGRHTMGVSRILKVIILALSRSSLSFFGRLNYFLTRFFKFPARREASACTKLKYVHLYVISCSIQLPLCLSTWRQLGHDEDSPSYTEHWSKLDAFFAHHGLTLWNRGNSDAYNQYITGLPAPNNYLFLAINHPDYTQRLSDFPVTNGLLHVARKDKRHYIVRVLSAGGEGLDILNIMRLLTRSPDNLLSNNHILPMEEIVYHDIVFGVYPLLGDSVRNAMMPFMQQCSVEDIVLIIMQALEVRQFYSFRTFIL